MRSKPLDGLSKTQKKNRIAALDALQSYWQEGQFPVNLNDSARKPIFIDHEDRACAVAYLLQETNEHALAYQINKENNYASIEALLAYPKLPVWAIENGFTCEELAWIQPGYAVPYFTPQAIGNDFGIGGGEVHDIQVFEDKVYFAGSFSTLDNYESPCLASWDGENFEAIPGLLQEVDEVRRIAFDETTGDLYVIGQFFGFPNFPKPAVFARYQEGTWTALLNSHQINNSEGQIRDIVCANGFCYLVGNIPELNGQSSDHLLVYDIEEDTLGRFSEQLFFTDYINDLSLANQTLLIGGAFTMLNSNGDTLSQKVAALDINTRTALESGHFSNSSYPGDVIVEAEYVSIIDTDEYTSYCTLLNDGTNLISGFRPLTGEGWWIDNIGEPISSANIKGAWRHLFYGSLQSQNYPSDFPLVLFSIPGEFGAPIFPITRANGNVTAMTKWNKEFVLAGDFSIINEDTINQLARATLLISGEDEIKLFPAIEVGSDGRSLFIKNLSNSANQTQLELFDVQGRLVWQYQFNAVSESHILTPPVLYSGNYVYRILNEEQMGVGKISLIY